MKKITILIAFALLLGSCVKDTIDDLSKIKGVTAESNWMLPVVDAEAGLEKFIGGVDDQVEIVADDQGKLTLIFAGRDSLGEKQLVSIDPLSVNQTLSLPAPAIPVFEAVGVFSESINDRVSLNLGSGINVENLQIKKGKVTVNITNSFQHNTFIKISYPAITKGGLPLVDSFEFNYTGTPHAPIIRTTSLDGYEIDANSDINNPGTIPYIVEFKLQKVTGSTTTPADAIVFNQTLSIEEYAKAEGYFGPIELLKLKESSRLGIFDKKIDGNVFINDPRLRIKVYNTIGMPIQGRISKMVIVAGLGDTVPVEINPFKDTFSINYTTIQGQEAITEYVIDRNNSNLDEVISSAPQYFIYEITFTANADNVPKTNVIYDKSTIKVDASFEIPADLRIVSYGVESQQSFSLKNDLNQLDSNGVFVEYAEALSEITNQMPLGAFVQVYFIDTITNTVLDSLYESQFVVPASLVNASGRVIAPAVRQSTTFIDKAKYERITAANAYSFFVRFRTSDFNSTQPFVVFYKQDKLRFKMGLKTKVKYQTP